MANTSLHDSAQLTYSNQTSIAARQEIFRLRNAYEATDEEAERSAGLFIRGSLLARLLATADVYKRIVGIPGAILDVGTWRGQTAVLCENLRAIYEPLDLSRRVIAFDTFDGYAGFAEGESRSTAQSEGKYGVGGPTYAEWLRNLLKLHESSNAMGHVTGKHSVIVGDVRTTLSAHFAENPGRLVALAFFDLGSFEATRSALETIWPRVVPGGVAAFWQFTRQETQGDGQAYLSVIGSESTYPLEYMPQYPGLCIITKR